MIAKKNAMTVARLIQFIHNGMKIEIIEGFTLFTATNSLVNFYMYLVVDKLILIHGTNFYCC